MKLNPKINFNKIVIFLIIINILGIIIQWNSIYLPKFFSNSEFFRIFLTFSIIAIPPTLIILGLFGLIKKENHSFSVLAIFWGIIVPMIIIGNALKGFN